MDAAAPIVFVLRHAHAVAGEPGGNDYDRSLDERGRREARGVGVVLAERGWKPDRIVCSGAARTRETLDGLGASVAGVETLFEEALYSGGRDVYLSCLRSAGEARALMLIGHNPAVAELVAALTGDGDALALRQIGQGVPTASLARLEFGKTLASVGERDGYLSHLVVPGA